MSETAVAAGPIEMLLFRVGAELFALPLVSSEEAIEGLASDPLPGMPPGMLGVARHRGGRLPVYAAAAALGVACGAAEPVTLVVRSDGARLGLVVDDVEDVIMTDLSALRPVPGPKSTDPVLRGVLPWEGTLVAVCDPEALVRACLGVRR